MSKTESILQSIGSKMTAIHSFMPMHGLLQRKCACGNQTLNGECRKCNSKKRRLQRKSSEASLGIEVPMIVYETLQNSGQLLNMNTREYMESRFEHDFSNVRVHTDAKAAESARVIDAQAYTVGQDVAFAEGKYRPDTNVGKSLLAHELAHVVQQNQRSVSSHPEECANLAAKQVMEGQTVSSSHIGGAPYGLFRQPTNNPKEDKKIPSVKAGKEEKVIIPAIKPPTKKTKAPSLPSRISIPGLSSRHLISAPGLGKPQNIGLRLGFPKLGEATGLQKRLLYKQPNFLKESLQQAQLYNHMLTGKMPTGWEGVDKGVFAKYVWGIFATNISPSLAAKIMGGLSSSTGSVGSSYELDLLLITDINKEAGGGVSLTVRW